MNDELEIMQKKMATLCHYSRDRLAEMTKALKRFYAYMYVYMNLY
jgi:hypothetical protein